MAGLLFEKSNVLGLRWEPNCCDKTTLEEKKLSTRRKKHKNGKFKRGKIQGRKLNSKVTNENV